MNNPHNHKHSNIKDCVMGRISSCQVSPRPRWYFMCLEGVVWGLWGLSVLVGAVAVSIIIFVLDRSRFALFEATHETALAYVIEVAPYLWSVTFVVMAVLAYVNYRHTNHGYRNSPTTVIGTSVGMSVVLGILLHVGGVGAYLDSMLAPMPMYESLEEVETALWQKPEAGRLVGQMDAIKPVFTDIEGKMWRVDVSEMQSADMELCLSGQTVRLLGIASSTAAVFHACGAFPWLFGVNQSVVDLARDRQAFVERMSAHKEVATAHAVAMESVVLQAADPETMKRCAELAAVKRIGAAAR